MPVVTSQTQPKLPPKFVAGYLGIPGSRLPRETMNTIRKATKPPVRRGGKGWYSWLDLLLMRLGGMLLENGLLPAKTQACIETVRHWMQEISEDPRLGTDEFDSERQLRWLIGKRTDEGFNVILGDEDDLMRAVIKEPSADAHVIINLYHFVNREYQRFIEYEKDHPIT